MKWLFLFILLISFPFFCLNQVLAQESQKQIIVLDPGHCSNDKYKETKIPENKLNLEAARLLKVLLDANGFDTRIYNPNGDGSCSEPGYYRNLQQRVDFANSSGAKAFVSIHADSGEQKDIFNPIYSPIGPFANESKRLADLIGEGISNSFSVTGKNIGTSTTKSTETGPNPGLDYYVLGSTGSSTSGGFTNDLPQIENERQMPGVIIENYMKTSSDYKTIFDDKKSMDAIALGYCNGISKFFGKQDCSNNPTPQPQTTPPANFSIVESTWCTQVGNPTSSNPCSNLTGQTTTTGSGEHPKAPPTDPSGLRQAIIDQFGITMNGFGPAQLQWAWEKFWDVSKTNFITLVKGSVINVTAPSNTQQVGCGGSASVLLGAFPEQELFKHILIHELGHVVRNCNNREKIQYNGHLEAYQQEKGVSFYGNNAPTCTGSDNLSEDYAEMIAYYLNPTTTVQTVRCSPDQKNPNMNTNFPLHFNIAQLVLGNY